MGTGTIHVVYPQLENAGPGDPGRVTEGFYTVIDGVVTMTDPEGNPVRDGDGKRIEQKVAKGETAQKVAGRLTLKIFHSRHDGMADFNKPTSSLKYPVY